MSDEFLNLSTIAESARCAGARVPEPARRVQVGGYSGFLQSPVEGRSAAAVLTGHPELIAEIMDPIVAWLASWNCSTWSLLPLTGERLERNLLVPLRALTPYLPDGEAYHAWLTHVFAQFISPVPFVTAHHDLTLWNVLLKPDSPPGIVDWSEAREESLPLADLFYIMVDAVTIALRINRKLAFRECFFSTGRYFSLVERYMAQIRKALDIPEGMAGLCLHACFLHHAMNEQRDRNPDDPQPFLGILRTLVDNREVMEGF